MAVGWPIASALGGRLLHRTGFNRLFAQAWLVAGVYGPRTAGLEAPGAADFDRVMHTNVLGAMRVLGRFVGGVEFLQLHGEEHAAFEAGPEGGVEPVALHQVRQGKDG